MKKLVRSFAVLVIAGMLTFGFAFPAFAAEGMEAVAGAEDYGSRDTIDDSGMTAITADDIADGTYTVMVETDSSMFSIVDCQLTVANGHMSAVITLSGTGYSHLFLGTPEEAAAADMNELVPFVENDEGLYTYALDEIPALNAAVDCSSYSTRKSQWYGHQIMFLAATLPADALSDSARATIVAESPIGTFQNGTYTIGVDANGATDTLVSPATMTVENGEGTVTLEWSSGNYDYMVVNGQTYEAFQNEAGNSMFTIPAQVFDVSIPVVVDTLENGTPEEQPCTISLHSGTIELVETDPAVDDGTADDQLATTGSDSANDSKGGMSIGLIVVCVALGIAIVIGFVRSLSKKKTQ